MNPLTVYKASAGSGKTFTLAVEYIKLLIENPNNYDSILAVTFTNKATEEMKMRILSQLYGISKGLPDSKDYADKVTSALKMNSKDVEKRAKTALSLLTHNYNYFRVQTIDTFFQSVLRNLARELDLTPNLRIGLNDVQVEEMAVDDLIESLSTSSPILQWLKDYVVENISEDKSWNVIWGIKKFGRNIFSDIYKENRQRIEEVLSQPEFFEKYSGLLQKLRKDAKDKIKIIGEAFFEALDVNGLKIEDFPYGKSGVCGYFMKLRRGEFGDDIVSERVKACKNNTDKWIKGSNPKNLKERIRQIVETELMRQLIDSERLRQELSRQYFSSDLTLRNLNKLRLLRAINDKVRELNATENRFLLSDTQSLLHELIKDSNDSPFIYEKIGSRLEHVMIDEFQDTSSVQWKNFKVLLEECISHSDHGSLIVGDVKQSIYRWRSGDWRLLNNIEAEFSSPNSQLQVESLKVNYRSSKSVVTFNNAFFSEAMQLEEAAQNGKKNPEASQIGKAYADVKQELPMKNDIEGMVSVKLLPKVDYEDNMLGTVKGFIDMLLSYGVNQNNIAILVRRNKDIPVLADYILQNVEGVSVVSDEAFRLDASLAVNVLIEAMRVLTHPAELLPKATLVKAWHEVLGDTLSDTDLFASGATLDSLLPDEFSKNTAKLISMPVPDMIDKLYSVFCLNTLEEQSAYVCTFIDILNNYLTDNVADIGNFLQQWDEDLHAKTIQSDEATGVRIISIHKSKGLEFDNVIIPYCDWKLERFGDPIWCVPTEEPYNALPIVPVDYYPNRMCGSIYEADYMHENLQNTVDNLNLLYVAFTRAGHNLFVIGKRDSPSLRSGIIQEALPKVTDSLVDSFLDNNSDKSEPIAFDYGKLYVPTKKKKKETQNVFQKVSEPYPMKIQSFDNRVEFRQSNKSRDFIEDDEASLSRQGYIHMGNVLHNIFSTIHTKDDIELTLKEMEEDGVLYDKEVTQDEVRRLIDRGLANTQVAEWFAPHWTLFNECSIIYVKDGQVVEVRPDRVMTDGHITVVVDYKFGRQKDEHVKQVKEYMEHLHTMGYGNIKGYLWYVKKNQVVECK